MRHIRTHIGVIILFGLGFFLAPNLSVAYVKEPATAHACCPTGHQEKAAHKDDGNESKPGNKDDDHNGCETGSTHDSCRCSHTVQALNLPMAAELPGKSQVNGKKKKFDFKPVDYTSGYYSVWLPPKIA